MRKCEIGKSRPTENRAANAIINRQVNEWVAKVDACQNIEGIQTQINAVADVIIDLAEQIKEGKVEHEVIMQLIKRRTVTASLQIAHDKLKKLPLWGK